MCLLYCKQMHAIETVFSRKLKTGKQFEKTNSFEDICEGKHEAPKREHCCWRSLLFAYLLFYEKEKPEKDFFWEFCQIHHSIRTFTDVHDVALCFSVRYCVVANVLQCVATWYTYFHSYTSGLTWISKRRLPERSVFVADLDKTDCAFWHAVVCGVCMNKCIHVCACVLVFVAMECHQSWRFIGRHFHIYDTSPRILKWPPVCVSLLELR